MDVSDLRIIPLSIDMDHMGSINIMVSNHSFPRSHTSLISCTCTYLFPIEKRYVYTSYNGMIGMSAKTIGDTLSLVYSVPFEPISIDGSEVLRYVHIPSGIQKIDVKVYYE
jgi:hypothetical protein